MIVPMDFSRPSGVARRPISTQECALVSAFALLDQDVVARGIARLNTDLASGAWDERFGHLRSLDALDVCYRLLVTEY
jgi:hypothetical protein